MERLKFVVSEHSKQRKTELKMDLNNVRPSSSARPPLQLKSSKPWSTRPTIKLDINANGTEVLQIGRIPENMTSTLMQEMAESFGEVYRMVWYKDQRRCFVEYVKAPRTSHLRSLIMVCTRVQHIHRFQFGSSDKILELRRDR